MEADDKVPGHFNIKKQRLFKNIHYFKGDMYLIVKTWEQVKYTENRMGWLTGLEPATSGATIRCSTW